MTTIAAHEITPSKLIENQGAWLLTVERSVARAGAKFLTIAQTDWEVAKFLG
jgi:hypothetical protein